MTQPPRLSLLETLAQAATGYAIAVGLTVWLYGVPWEAAAALSPAYVLASILRGYVVRRLFARRPEPKQPSESVPLAYATFAPGDGARLVIKRDGVLVRSVPLSRAQALNVIETLLPRLR